MIFLANLPESFCRFFFLDRIAILEISGEVTSRWTFIEVSNLGNGKHIYLQENITIFCACHDWIDIFYGPVIILRANIFFFLFSSFLAVVFISNCIKDYIIDGQYVYFSLLLCSADSQITWIIHKSKTYYFLSLVISYANI